MNRMQRAVLVLIGVMAVGSLAVAAVWQYASQSASTEVARSDGANAAPESRSIFPKVLNR